METEKFHAYLDAIEADSQYYSVDVVYRPAKIFGTHRDAYSVTLEFLDSIYLKIGVVAGEPLGWINYLTLWNASRGDVETITLIDPMLEKICDRFDLLPLVKHIIEDTPKANFHQPMQSPMPLTRHISI